MTIPRWSKMGKMVADTKAAVDALTNLDFVDGSKIVVSGIHSGNGGVIIGRSTKE